MLTFCEEKAIEMKFNNQIPFRMKRVGGNVYRNHDRSQILFFQDVNKDIAEPGTNEPERGTEMASNASTTVILDNETPIFA